MTHKWSFRLASSMSVSSSLYRVCSLHQNYQIATNHHFTSHPPPVDVTIHILVFSTTKRDMQVDMSIAIVMRIRLIRRSQNQCRWRFALRTQHDQTDQQSKRYECDYNHARGSPLIARRIEQMNLQSLQTSNRSICWTVNAISPYCHLLSNDAGRHHNSLHSSICVTGDTLLYSQQVTHSLRYLNATVYSNKDRSWWRHINTYTSRKCSQAVSERWFHVFLSNLSVL